MIRLAWLIFAMRFTSFMLNVSLPRSKNAQAVCLKSMLVLEEYE